MKLIRIMHGKEEIIAEGSRKELRKEMLKLKRSQRKGLTGRGNVHVRAEYRITA